MRRLGLALTALGLGLVLSAGASGASERNKKRPKMHRDRSPEFPAHAADSKAYAAAAMTSEECLSELERREVHFHKAGPSPGVVTPIRLDGALGGVVYRTDYPERERGSVPYEVLDCRLAVALSNLSPILRDHGIDEVRMFSAWRPPPGLMDREQKPGNAHPGGLAADLRLFKKSGGTELSVDADFHGRIGSTPCGPGAGPSAKTDRARELRSILCAAAEARLFHVLLSPNFDARHRNHFHVEVRPGVRWFIVR